MAELENIDNDIISDCTGDTYVTCAGTVRAPHGAGVSRKVAVFMDNNPTYLIGITASVLPLGTFSVSVIALPSTGLTVVTIGEVGENSVINSHCREF